MKILYIARVFFVSIEFLLALVGCGVLYFFEEKASFLVQKINMNPEMEKFLIALPVGLLIWIFKEGKDFLGNEKIVISWPEYWKLKVHVYTAYFYSVIFCLISAVPWVSKSGISTGKNLIIFGTATAICIWAAASLYFAQLTVKEIINK